jgi:hypothetical protein
MLRACVRHRLRERLHIPPLLASVLYSMPFRRFRFVRVAWENGRVGFGFGNCSAWLRIMVALIDWVIVDGTSFRRDDVIDDELIGDLAQFRDCCLSGW